VSGEGKAGGDEAEVGAVHDDPLDQTDAETEVGTGGQER